MSDKKRYFSRETAIADGWVEGKDFVVNDLKKIVCTRANVPRKCIKCLRTKEPSRFYSGLHRVCRQCMMHAGKGIELGSPEHVLAVANSTVKDTPKQKRQLAVAVTKFSKELAARTLVRRRLVNFIERFQPGYQAGWVHKDICRRLERFMLAVERKESPRLLICMPPRLGKSTIGSQHFPAWMLGHHPDWSVIAASYNITLPAGFSRLIRGTLRDPMYQAVFPETRLSDESQAVESWKTTAEGGYVAAGVGTGITGKGCFSPLSSVVDSRREYTAIFHLKVGDEVLAYDHQFQRPVYAQVLAVHVSRHAVGAGKYAGVRCTADHELYSPATQRYHPAADLVEQGLPVLQRDEVAEIKRVRRVLPGSTPAHGRQDVPNLHSEEGATRPPVFAVPPERGPRVREAVLCWLRGIVRADLWRGAQGRAPLSADVLLAPVCSQVTDKAVRCVQALQRGLDLARESVLQSRMLLCFTARPELQARVQLRVFDAEAGGDAAGRPAMRAVERDTAAGSSPHRPRRGEQHHGEHDYVEPGGARALSRASGRCAADLAAHVVRTRDEPHLVVDVQTTTGNLFVDGALAHNCHVLVIDDPIKDMEAANSPHIRDMTWDWYTPVASTRLAPGGGILGIMTMWHDDDWSGRIQEAALKGGDKFEIVKYPAINEEGDEYLIEGTDEIVYIAPSSQLPAQARLLRRQGEALHPDRFSLDDLLAKKRNFVASGQARMWSALYQQKPLPDEGALFKKDMFRYVATPPDASQGRVFQAWDFSITEKETSDWIVGATMLQDEHDNVYEMDMMRFKVDEDSIVIADAIIDCYVKQKAWIVGFEDGQIFKSMKAILLRRCKERKVNLNYETLTPLTDKMVRAGPLRGRMQMGKMFFDQSSPHRETVDNELLRFPGGKHDDIVDAYSWCMRLILAYQPVATASRRQENKRRELSLAQKLKQYMTRSDSHMTA